MITGRQYLNSKSKRFLDIFLALIVVLLTLPIILLSTIVIKFEDGGNIVFRQQRIGKNGEEFTIYKLRTMSPKTKGDTYAFPKLPDNPQITKIGKLLRPPAIDELPQLLINVLVFGNMSFVGVRPLPTKQYKDYLELFNNDSELFPEEMLNRWNSAYVSGRPGFMSLVSAKGRAKLELNKEGIRKKLELDIEYVHRASLFFDLWIIKETVKSFLNGEGAW